MKLTKFYCENLYSFQSFSLNFEDYEGLISIILGKNLDDDTDNGAGKSSILKAIYWTFYNEDVEKATLDSIKNRNSNNGMLGIIEFTDRGHHYKITRYRKYKKNEECPYKLCDGSLINGTGVEFLVNGESMLDSVDNPTPDGIQKIIQLKIKYSPKLFLSTILMRQKADKHFITVDDTEKKNLLSEILDLSAYGVAFDKVKKEITELNTQLADNETKIEGINNNIEQLENDFISLSEEDLNYEKNKIEKIKKIDIEIFEENEKINKLKKGLVSIDNVLELKNSLNEKIEFNKKLNEKIKDEERLNEYLKKLNNDLNKIVINIENNVESLKKIDESIINSQKLKKEKIEQKNEANIIVKEKSFYDNKITIIDEKLEKYALLKKEILNNEKIIEKNLTDTESLNTKIDQLNIELDKILHESVCNECQQKIENPETLNKMSIDKKTLIDNSKKQIELNKSELNKLINNNFEINKLIEDELSLINEKEQLKTDKNANDINEIKLKDFLQKIEEIENGINDKNNERNQIIEKNKELEKNNINVNEKIAKATKLQKEFSEIKKTIEKNKDLIDECKLKINNEEKKQIQNKSINDLIVNHNKNIDERNNDKNKLVNEENPLKKSLANNRKNLELMNKNKNVISNLINMINDKLKYLNFWKIGFAPTGIRSFITDDVIELLNKKTQENINDLFDGALSVQFSPESENGKGVVSNKISTKFLYNGKETSWELLSGGQKQRLIIASNLALTDIAESRTGTSLNLRFLDEPFDGIDNKGQTKSLTLFNKIARRKDGFFIISHDEKFQNLCQKAIYIVFKNENSKIVSKKEFDEASTLKNNRENGGNSSTMSLDDLLKF